MHTWRTHATYTSTCVREKEGGKKSRQRRERGVEICPIYTIGFQIKSIRLKGVPTCASGAMFMLWKKIINWLTLNCKPTVSRGEDEMTLQQLMFHLIQSNKYLIALNSLLICQQHDLWQWTRLNDCLAKFSTCWDCILESVLFLAANEC